MNWMLWNVNFTGFQHVSNINEILSANIAQTFLTCEMKTDEPK